MEGTVKHTPGEWLWMHSPEEKFVGMVFARDAGYASVIALCPAHTSKERWEADARLIATAPAMLELLQLMVTVDGDQKIRAWHRSMNGLISNATGEKRPMLD